MRNGRKWMMGFREAISAVQQLTLSFLLMTAIFWFAPFWATVALLLGILLTVLTTRGPPFSFLFRNTMVVSFSTSDVRVHTKQSFLAKGGCWCPLRVTCEGLGSFLVGRWIVRLSVWNGDVVTNIYVRKSRSIRFGELVTPASTN